MGGWKVEMKGEGSAMRWHLTSKLHDEELVFQLRPPESGRGAEFDLLSTDWAERLQEDRQAMAYLHNLTVTMVLKKVTISKTFHMFLMALQSLTDPKIRSLKDCWRADRGYSYILLKI